MSKRNTRDNGAYRAGQRFEQKTMPTVVKEIDAEHGIVQHYVAIMGNLDDGNDIIMPGAFTKTVAENARRVRVLDCHNTDSVLRVVGRPLALREVGRAELPAAVLEVAPDATGALLATTQYALDTKNGREVFELIKGGYLPETSIGFDTLQEDYEQQLDAKGKPRTVRLLKEIRLWEYSNVLWGMNPATATVSAKEKGATAMYELKRVMPVLDAALAPRETEWDGPAAESRVRAWATNADGELNWGDYARAFMWYDTESPEQFGAYHLAIGDIADGELVIVPRGVFTVAAALRGSRGATLPYLSDADRARVITNVNRYYARMRAEFEDEGLISPLEEMRAMPALTTKQAGGRTLDAYLNVLVYQAANSLLDNMLLHGRLTREQRMTVYAALESALDVMATQLPPAIAELQPYADYEHEYYTASAPGQLKSGRAISKQNATRITAALQALHDAIAVLQVLLLEAGIDVEDAAPPEIEAIDSKRSSFELERQQLITELQAL